MVINMKPVKDGIKEVIQNYKDDCVNKVNELKRYDEFNTYGNPKSYKTLVSLSEVLDILKEQI